MRQLIVAALCGMLTAGAGAQDDYTPPTGKLVKMVVVSRHGVRSPLEANSALAAWTVGRAWPAWPTGRPGLLTDRGGELAALMGGYYRVHAAQAELVPAGECPAPRSVFIRADVDERTVATAQAIARGFAPDCRIDVRRAAPSPDPLFHPTKARVCAIGAKKAERAIRARLPDGFAGLDRKHGAAIATTQDLLQCCRPEICSGPHVNACCRTSACAKTGVPGSACKLTDIPTGLTGGKTGLRMCGAIGIGSTASEIFLLEYAQGMREQDVAWGALNGANLERLQSALTLHNAQFDLMERTPYIAARQGSMLLRAVLSALQGNAAGGQLTGPMPPNDAAFVAFVGHDTNLANLGAMIEAEWSATPQVPDQTAPASALVFELRVQANGARDVYVYYQAQSLAQMRERTALTAARPPVRKSLHLTRCSRGEPGAPCELAEFSAAIKRSLVTDCLK